MKSIDQFLSRSRGNDYNCFDFVREVWKYLYNEDIGDILEGLQAKDITPSTVKRLTERFRCIKKPTSPCLVLMQRMRLCPHIGMYLDGRILHLGHFAVEFELPYVVTRLYTKVRYYR